MDFSTCRAISAVAADLRTGILASDTGYSARQGTTCFKEVDSYVFLCCVLRAWRTWQQRPGVHSSFAASPASGIRGTPPLSDYGGGHSRGILFEQISLKYTLSTPEVRGVQLKKRPLLVVVQDSPKGRAGQYR